MGSKHEKPSRQASLLDRWLNRKKEGSATRDIPPIPRGTAIPLSLGQQRLWFLQQLYPENPFYHYSDAYRLKGPFVFDKLLEAMRILAERHAIMRTTFPAIEGRPVQLVNRDAEFDVATFDLQHVRGEYRLSEANMLARKEAQRPFDLGRGTLIRITLICLGERDHLMLITMHHIITDKWSMEVLYRDLAKVYQRLTLGLPIQIEEPGVQYADFAYWQNAQIVDQNHMAFWKDKLAGELPMLNLPTDYPRPVKSTYRGGLIERSYSRRLAGQLKELAVKTGTTSFVLLLTAFKVLLQRYSHQEDILVGTPFSNRDRTSLENVMGFFNDTLVLRSDLSGDPGFVSLLEQVRQTVLDAFSHKNMPFESLVKTLAPGRDLTTNPIFQVMFLYDKASISSTFAPELDVTCSPFDFGVAKFDLTLYVSENEDSFKAIFEYAKDLFDPQTIERMHEHMENLLECIVKQPDAAISSFSLLSASERRQLLHQWNATDTTHMNVAAIHHLFERQAEVRPRHTALIYNNESFSYAELNARADLVSARLRVAVTSGSIIGLCARRSPDLIVGIMAILKAGAAYLPLDPEYPVERLHYMVEDADVNLILAQEDVAGLFDGTGVEICTFTANTGSGIQPVAFTLPQFKPDDLAYVIYTSGSTGKPKGVAVTHANLVHSTLARELYYPQAPSTFMLLSSFSFDSSVAGIFWTLSSGGTLILAEHHMEQDMARLADLIAIHRVTHTLMLPSLYALLLGQAPVQKLNSLNTVIVAGEPCSSMLCRTHLRVLPQVELYNEYGPTEATVWCTVHKITEEDTIGVVPIGRPIANTQAYILDKRLQPVPVGVAGELFIAGAGVARGYLNRDEQTALVFVPDPFGNNPAQRLYRTGDLVRYRRNGLIDYLGRVDQQVKIRGFRVELNEIREALLIIPAVRDAEVIIHDEEKPSDLKDRDRVVELLDSLDPDEAQSVHKQTSGSYKRQQIVAYVSGETTVNATYLRERLRTQLPAYMVPVAFVMLDEMPRLPNGKVDQRELPPPTRTTEAPESGCSKPRTPVEQRLVSIWEEVLDIHPVGIHDNFFEIGGDSILSIQIVARARKAGLVLGPNLMFEHQTIAELCLFIQSEEIAITALDEDSNTPPLTPIQYWFFDEHKVAPHHWNHVMRYTIEPNISVTQISKAVEILIEHHDALRFTFSLNDGNWECRIKEPERQGSVHYFDVSHCTATEQRDFVAAKSKWFQEDFNLSDGSLFQALFFQCQPLDQNILILISHHLLVDAVSWQIISGDLKTLLDEPNAMLFKSNSYQTWSMHLTQDAQLGKYDDELPFWKEQVQQSECLPTDLPMTLPVTEESIERLPFVLDSYNTGLLLKDALPAYRMRPEEILATAFLVAIEKWCGLDTLTLWFERHGRQSLEIELDVSNTVGWFTSFYPQRLSHDPQKDAGTILKQVKEQIRQVPNGGVGYGVLRYLRSDKGHSTALHCPTCVIFNYLGNQAIAAVSPPLSGATMVMEGARAATSERNSQLEINSYIHDGQLLMQWSFSRNHYRVDTIERLIDNFSTALHELIRHCAAGENGGYTPSDFPDAGLSQEDLDALLNRL